MRGVSEEQVARARELDLLSYLQAYEPGELKPDGPGRFTTVTHGSLIISNGKWWWNRGQVGGISALDYLMKVRGMDFVAAVEHLTGERAETAKTYQAEAKLRPPTPKWTFYPPRPCRYATGAVSYLQSRGISTEIIRQCIQLGILYESRYYNPQSQYHNNPVCVFAGKDETGAIKFAAMRGLSGDFKQDKAGSDKRFNFHSAQNPGSRPWSYLRLPLTPFSRHAPAARRAGHWDGTCFRWAATSDARPHTHFWKRNRRLAASSCIWTTMWPVSPPPRKSKPGLPQTADSPAFACQ